MSLSIRLKHAGKSQAALKSIFCNYADAYLAETNLQDRNTFHAPALMNVLEAMDPVQIYQGYKFEYDNENISLSVKLIDPFDQ